MLVLSRRAGEGVRIGNQVAVQVLEIAGNKVRVGIAAPDGIRIVRAELDLCEVACEPARGAGTSAFPAVRASASVTEARAELAA